MVELAKQEPLVEVTCPYCYHQQMTSYTLMELNALKEGGGPGKINDQCGKCDRPFFYRLGKDNRVVVSMTL